MFQGCTTVTTSWVLYKDNIYVTVLQNITDLGSDNPTLVFADNKELTYARAPNTDFYRVESATKTTVTDTERKESDGFFNGALLRQRTVNWHMETRQVYCY